VSSQRDEVALKLCQTNELLMRERAVDRDGGPLRHHLQQLHVLLRKPPRGERPNVHDSDHVAVRDQRYAREGLDPLLSQDRIEDVAVVDVVEDDGSAMGRDAAGEALPEWDAHAALDLLLDSFRRARHELGAGFVQQEECGRVGVQRFADAEEQLVEQPLERQMCERDIGDSLEPPELLRCLECPVGRTVHEPEMLLQRVQQLLDALAQLARAERLRHELVDAGLFRPRPVELARAGGQHDHVWLLEPAVASQRAADVVPVEVRHHRVEDDEARP
jgi:hypothetical protein